jgi:hypothetical protein
MGTKDFFGSIGERELPDYFEVRELVRLCPALPDMARRIKLSADLIALIERSENELKGQE